MKKFIFGLLAIAMLAIATSAMALTNTVTYPGTAVGFGTTVWNGSAWVGISPTLDSLTIDANVATIGSYHLSNNAITPELFSEATQVIVSAAVGVRSKNYRPTPGYHCRYCRYSHACPDGKCYLDAGSSFSA